MQPAEINVPKTDALAYLLGGIGLLAISALPIMSLALSAVQPVAKLVLGLYWLLGAGLLWWAVRRFTGLGERLAAVVGIVIGWYIVLQLLMVLETMVFRF
ncbi:hypothetical protein HHL22_19580 [Hymenobacter sp. RP-2-7]|uniref:Uncharacterized protein n=1 Tax=Hymenobacter polaris TaxID=2682546 RepID=A0A7Y0FPC8_9BACT|nr:hypothetical protein [Hymenobacter polaris]NML67410.1 hypothetical protein [Hymenobacter polaris]